MKLTQFFAVLISLITVAQPYVARPAQLRVDGTRVVDGSGGRVRLRGVNAASMEWSCDGEGHILQTVRVAIRDWHANVVRLPLAQDRWFGKTAEQKDEGAAYRALVKQVVDTCSDLGAYVILDLHWSDVGRWGEHVGQHSMPDDNSTAFWKECAGTYKNNPAVLFDLYNEPFGVSWDVWLSGGEVTERVRGEGVTYHTPGMQALLDTVRATGAKNVVIAGGLNWAYDMSGFLEGKRLKDPQGNGVVYANHTYPFKGDTVEKWLAKMDEAAKLLPIIVTEFGAGGRPRPGELPQAEWIRAVVAALEKRGWNWTAWDMHPSASPSLIADWSYAPTDPFGTLVKQALARSQ